jgi:hypothetical protein
VGQVPSVPSESSRTDHTEPINNTQLIAFKQNTHRKPLIMGGSHNLPPHQYPTQFITFITDPRSPAPPAATPGRLRRPIKFLPLPAHNPDRPYRRVQRNRHQPTLFRLAPNRQVLVEAELQRHLILARLLSRGNSVTRQENIYL